MFPSVWLDLLRLIRLDRWFNKLEITFFCGAILFLTTPQSTPFDILVFFTAYNLVFYPYLYLINSVCERDDDLKAGKDIYYGFSHRAAVWITVLFGAATLALTFYPGRLGTAIVGVLLFIDATIYSLEPFHLKRRGFWGTIAGPFYQRVLPFLFLVSLLDTFVLSHVAYLSGWLFLRSFEVFLLHGLGDYEGDLATNSKTIVVQFGPNACHRMRAWIQVLLVAYAGGALIVFDFSAGVFVAAAVLLFKFKNGHVDYSLSPDDGAETKSISPTMTIDTSEEQAG